MLRYGVSVNISISPNAGIQPSRSRNAQPESIESRHGATFEFAEHSGTGSRYSYVKPAGSE